MVARGLRAGGGVRGRGRWGWGWGTDRPGGRSVKSPHLKGPKCLVTADTRGVCVLVVVVAWGEGGEATHQVDRSLDQLSQPFSEAFQAQPTSAWRTDSGRCQLPGRQRHCATGVRAVPTPLGSGPCLLHNSQGRAYFTTVKAVPTPLQSGPCLLHYSQGRAYFTRVRAVPTPLGSGLCPLH